MPLVQRTRHARPTPNAAVAGDWSFHCKPSVYDWTPEDYAALRAAAQELNTTPEDLLLVMELESVRNPRRAFCNKDGYPTAAGLNQITYRNAQAMGITEEERLSLLKMSAAEQMPYVVRSFLAARGGKPFPTPPDAVTLYQTNIAPGTVPSETVYRQKVSPCPPPDQAKDAYCANAGLDYDKDGVITRSDLKVKLDQIAQRQGYKDAVVALQSQGPVEDSFEYQESPEQASSGAPVLLLGGLVAGAYFLFREMKP